MADVAFNEVDKIYDNGVQAVFGLTLDISDGEFLVLVGPSGCGKTTALRMVAGLEDISGGTVSIGGRVVNDLSPKERDIAMVFQNYALYPHLSVFENIAFPLRLHKMDDAEVQRRVNEAADVLDLHEHLERKPANLSGGQRQRVAMGRAIVRQPKVFCMDEPLSNLDAKLRVSTRTQIAALQQRLGITTVYVTHDQVEAMTLGQRVAVLRGGVLQQVDTPLNLYDRPANLFVASFIGSPAMNLLQASPDQGGARIGDYVVPIDRTAAARSSGEITVGVRPESWRLVPDGEGGLPVTVSVIEELGADAYMYGTSDVEGTPSDVIVRLEARRAVEKGATVHVTTDPERVHVFDTATGARLSA